MKEVSCKTCPYWVYIETQRIPTDDGSIDLGVGECRIRAPRMLKAGGVATPGIRAGTMENKVAYTVAFPRMSSDLWCGEHPDFPTPLKFDPESGGFNRTPTLEEAMRYRPEADNEQSEPLRRAVEADRQVFGEGDGTPTDG